MQHRSEPEPAYSPCQANPPFSNLVDAEAEEEEEEDDEEEEEEEEEEAEAEEEEAKVPWNQSSHQDSHEPDRSRRSVVQSMRKMVKYEVPIIRTYQGSEAAGRQLLLGPQALAQVGENSQFQN